MGKYADSEQWQDIVPIPQDDGGPNPLAAIAYTEEYSEAMSYLRAVMAENEKSERALTLTEDIIRMNPAHYTVWYVSPKKKHHSASPKLTREIQALQGRRCLCLEERPIKRARVAQQDLSQTSQELPDMVSSTQPSRNATPQTFPAHDANLHPQAPPPTYNEPHPHPSLNRAFLPQYHVLQR